MNIHFICLIILGVVSIVYLTTLFFKAGVFQFILKGCLIPLILAVYITGANIILLPIVLALVFAWIGDVVLIKIDNLVCFRIGLASFLIGHIFYVIAMFEHAMPLHYPAFFISIAVGASLGFLLIKIVKPTPEMKIPVIVYAATILLMAISALQLYLSQDFPQGLFGILVFTGSLCFVASDSSLAMVTFQKKPYYVFCMTTYIAAQLLITLGFCQFKI
ncbi:MAG: lysoplasmalogenase [Treponema sp.]|nr:lysoplasmalogenase [Treponema sp.]MCL2252296.1 lysoplasmalogenase [Treponema sp.]